jgi:hypothetical protein
MPRKQRRNKQKRSRKVASTMMPQRTNATLVYTANWGTISDIYSAAVPSWQNFEGWNQFSSYYQYWKPTHFRVSFIGIPTGTTTTVIPAAGAFFP